MRELILIPGWCLCHQRDLVGFLRMMMEGNLNLASLELLDWFGPSDLRLKVNLEHCTFEDTLSQTAAINIQYVNYRNKIK